MKIACQEQLLPGDTILEKWQTARRYGFDGIELRGQDDHRIRDRLPDLQAAREEGVVFPTVCVEMDHFIGDFDSARRRNAIANMATQLEVIGALGGVGAMTPASWGMFSRRLPPFEPPRSRADDRRVLHEALSELASVATDAGVVVMLEPLNRYEDHMVNTLGAARRLADEAGSPAVRIVADTFHMDIEETGFEAAVAAAGSRLAHVQVSDSNRLEPGAGHLDWARLLRALVEVGYDGWLAYECRLSDDAASALPRSVGFLRKHLGTVGA